MSTKPPLTDDQVYERLHEALLALGTEGGATTLADTTIKAARRSLFILEMGLLAAGEKASDVNAVILDRADPSAPER